MKIKYEESILNVELMKPEDCMVELFKASKRESSQLFSFELVDLANMGCKWSDFVAYIICDAETGLVLDLCFLSNKDNKLSGIAFAVSSLYMEKNWFLNGEDTNFFNFALGIATLLLGNVKHDFIS